MIIRSLRALTFGGCVAIAGVAVLATAARGDTVVQYQFGTPGQETTAENSPVFNPTVVISGVTATAVLDPAGTVGLESSSAATTPATAPFLRLDPQGSSADPNAALAGNKYFQFSISANPGTDLDLSSLTFNVARGGAATPRGFFVSTSADNFATAIPVTGTPAFTSNAVNAMGNDISTARPAYTAATASLAGAAFQNIQNQPSSTLTFRFFEYSPGAGSSVDFDDITVNGTAVVPEPGTAAIAGAAFLLGGIGRRRRQAAV